MTATLLDVSSVDGVRRIALNRPQKRNALSRELIHQLQAEVTKASQEDCVRLVVLAAEGSVFCAGMDLAEMQDRATHDNAQELWKQDTQTYRDLLVSLVTLPKPTLAVVQGPALAGGMGLAMACDLVLASDAALFGLPEPKRGITAAVVAPLVCYRAGISTASFLLLSGKNLIASESLSRGLCHQVVSGDDLKTAEQALCHSILTGAPAALAATKTHLLNTAGRDLIPQLDTGMQVSAQARETQDAREGLAAFLEKRDPQWSPS
ncbi:MAG: enoyl-CoA hydratase/isomerase family protein [Planctomycetaceae bacterium]|nr:enoyl-CoA hydratase/isomerase family protein [Planctomycetaceae bacterium]